MDLNTTLKQYFGFNEFRPYQEAIIRQILADSDVLAVLPTGSGKSLCYQLPALLSAGTAIVVSPLIALMADQVQQLQELGISAAYLNSTLSSKEKFHIMDNFSQYKLIYVAPERLLDDSFLSFISSQRISFFVIDEAHCISQWGHSFRPEYRQLSTLKQLFPDRSIMALTATATPDVQADICSQLKIPKEQLILGSFERSNLSIKISQRLSGSDQLIAFCNKHKQESGIIYASTRKKVEQIYNRLSELGHSVAMYHAGLPDQDRHSAQEGFIKDDIQIIVATVAFGMGINKPNVRYVLHYDMPKNMEQYYQEIGRAGRDGLPAICHLFFSAGDIIIQKRFIDDIQDEAVAHHLRRKAEQLLAFCNSVTCRTTDILAYFGERYAKENCGHCDNCTETVDTIDGTIISQKILSGVYRVGQRFGINHVVDMLVGSKNKKIQQFRHDQLSTYGILSEHNRKELQHFMYSLINQGYLYVTEDKFPVLKLSKKAWPIASVTDVRFKRLELGVSANKSKKASKEKLLFSDNPDLFNALKVLRKSIADSQGVPAFVVLHDSTLIDLSNQLPSNEAELLQVNGLGPKKVQRYGDDLLRCISEFKGAKQLV